MNRGDIMLISSGYDQQIKFWSDIQDTKCKHSFEYKESVKIILILGNKLFRNHSKQKCSCFQLSEFY